MLPMQVLNREMKVKVIINSLLVQSSSSINPMLNFQAMMSCVIPSDLISGGMGQRIEFPQWLGKNSKYGRLDRILQELQSHMRLR